MRREGDTVGAAELEAAATDARADADAVEGIAPHEAPWPLEARAAVTPLDMAPGIRIVDGRPFYSAVWL